MRKAILGIDPQQKGNTLYGWLSKMSVGCLLRQAHQTMTTEDKESRWDFDIF
jgi:hypothetical protein